MTTDCGADMAPKDSAQNNEEARDLDVGRRKAARYLVPVAVAGVAAATIGLPALAGPGDPSLPKITARSSSRRSPRRTPSSSRAT